MFDCTEPLCEGYLRPDGRKGIRNKLLVIHTVDCSSHVAYCVADALRLRGIESEVIGQRSCFDHQGRVRALLAYCVHPNVGGVLVVAAGCENIKPDKISRFASSNGRPSRWYALNDAGGTEKGIEKGLELAAEIAAGMERGLILAPVRLADLTICGKCGGSDFTSGLAGNTLVGSVFDRLVDAGGSCLFAEINEGMGLRSFFVERGATETAKAEIAAAYDKAERSCRLGGRFFISTGNQAGGLTTIEEKSLGSSAKSGSRPIQGVLKIGQRPPWNGLWLFDETTDDVYPHRLPHEGNHGGDCAILMLMGTAGCQVSLLITGRGHTCGVSVSPTVKITGNPRTFERMQDDIDINASKLLTGEKNMEQMTDELLEYVADVCRGKLTNAERLGHRENEMWSISQDTSATGSPCL
jgi:altronate hydrolase